MINDHIRQSNLYNIMLENAHNDEEICREISSYIATKVDIDIIDKLLTSIEIDADADNIELIIDIIDYIRFKNNNDVLLFIVEKYYNVMRYRDCIQDVLTKNCIEIELACNIPTPYLCPKLTITNEDIKCYNYCLKSTHIKEINCVNDMYWIISIITINNDLEVLEIYSSNTNIGFYERLSKLTTLKLNVICSCHCDNDILCDSCDLSGFIDRISKCKNITKLYIPYDVPNMFYVDYYNHNLLELHLCNRENDIYGKCDLRHYNENTNIYLHLQSNKHINKLVIKSNHNNLYIVTDNPSNWTISCDYNDRYESNIIYFPNRTKEVLFIDKIE